MKIGYLLFVVINLIVALDCARFYDYDLVEDDTKSGFVAGDYIIGALFPIHDGFDDEDYQCHAINYYEGIQIAEAAFFAIDLINRNEDILPNVTLGIEIKDYCNAIEVAVLQSKKLVDKAVSRSNETEDIFSPAQKGIESPLIGMIGPDHGLIFKEVQNIFKFFSIVQVGYSESLTELFYEELNPYFFTVIPSNQYMTEAIFDVLVANNWTYVSVIHSEDPFGIAGAKRFKTFAPEKGVCIGDIVSSDTIFNAVQNSDIEEFLDHMWTIMSSYDKVNVIVCYCSPDLLNALYYLIKIQDNTTKKFVVIGGDGWPPRHPYEREYEDVAVGEIQVSLRQAYIKEFDDYFLNLNLQTNKRNPWFAEFWEDRFNCKVDPSRGSEYPKCSGTEKFGDGYKQNPKVPYVIESVFVLAQALHDMLKVGCEDIHSGRLPMKNAFYKSCYQRHVEEVKFDFYGESIEFQYDRIPKIIKYNYHNFQLLENGSYDYVQIGEYIKKSKYEDEEVIMNGKLVYPDNKTFIKSSCGEPCSPNHAKVLKKDACCWDCVLCKPLEILVDSTRCVSCTHGFMSDANKTHCIPIPMERIKYNNVQLVISVPFSLLSIILSSFACYIFIKNRHTPVVKSSTKELCYIMFIGMFTANLFPFTVLIEPNRGCCITLRILPAISFTLIYAALLVKTNRIARILAISKKKFPNMNPKFLSLRAQVIFTAILISIEILICLHSLYKYPTEPSHVYRQRKDSSYYGVKICSLNEDVILETYAFVGVLILSCTYYAVKTRNLPENFNEAKYIGFAMYATILTDIAFGMIYFGSEVKILVINLCISINTLIVLIFLFTPKLYVILCKPQNNTRANFVTTTNIRCFVANRQNVSESGYEGESGISIETSTNELGKTAYAKL